MRNPYGNIYNQFVQQSPVPLQSKLSPKAFSRNGDQFIMVCDPSFPTIGNCRYHQSMANLNPHQRSKLAEKAEKLGLAMIPALNIDLSALKQYKIEKMFRSDVYQIKLTIAPNGNVRIMDASNNHNFWVKTGANKARATLKVFEHMFFGKWKVDVIVTSKKGLVLKLTRKINKHHEIILSGALKKSELDNGLEATVYPLHSDQILDLGILKIGGDFGFKIKITGEWKLWETLGKHNMTDVYIEWENENQSIEPHAQYAHFFLPEKEAIAGGIATTTAILSRWFLLLRPMAANMFADIESMPMPPP